jgi:hypothetical protein
MNDRYLVLILVGGIAVLVCVTLIVLAVLNRACSAEHDLRRRALRLMAGMTAVPAITLYAAKTTVTGVVAVAVAIIWAIVLVNVMRLVFRSERPP